ncbi:hypothetical protein RFI_17216, partial [Reticulomyxa filosa]
MKYKFPQIRKGQQKKKFGISAFFLRNEASEQSYDPVNKEIHVRRSKLSLSLADTLDNMSKQKSDNQPQTKIKTKCSDKSCMTKLQAVPTSAELLCIDFTTTSNSSDCEQENRMSLKGCRNDAEEPVGCIKAGISVSPPSWLGMEQDTETESEQEQEQEQEQEREQIQTKEERDGYKKMKRMKPEISDDN